MSVLCYRIAEFDPAYKLLVCQELEAASEVSDIIAECLAGHPAAAEIWESLSVVAYRHAPNTGPRNPPGISPRVSRPADPASARKQ